MATIPVKGARLVRKTITFTGGANAGQLDSPITVFALTGLVRLLSVPAPYISTALVCSNAEGVALTYQIGTSFGLGELFITQEMDFTGATGWLQGTDGNISPDGGNECLSSARPIPISADITLTPADSASGANITSGVMVCFAVYEPLSDDGALAGDDIDETWEDHLWSRSERTLTAIDEDSTTLDIDAAVRGALGLASNNLDTQLAAIPTLAELQAEIASGDDAVLAAIAGLNDLDGTAIATAVWGAASRTLTALGFTLQASDLAANTIGASELAPDAVTEIVTGVWTTALTEAYNTDGAAPTGAQALFVIMQRLVDFAISGTTISVKRIDGTTEAYTLTLNDASNPTSSARAT